MQPRDVLFLPGFMCDERLFGPQLAGLEAVGVRTAVGDLSAHDSVEALAAAVLRAAPRRFALAGLSMGGIVALEVVRQAPGRVTHLALLNSTPRADARGEQRSAQLRRVADGDLGALVAADLAPRYFAAANRSPERLALVTDMAERLGPEVFVRQTRALMGRRSYLDTLGRLSCPCLVLGGTEDHACPVDLQHEMAHAIPGARLVVLSGCGHLSTLERPDEVLQALLALFDLSPTDRARGRVHGRFLRRDPGKRPLRPGRVQWT